MCLFRQTDRLLFLQTNTTWWWCNIRTDLKQTEILQTNSSSVCLIRQRQIWRWVERTAAFFLTDVWLVVMVTEPSSPWCFRCVSDLGRGSRLEVCIGVKACRGGCSVHRRGDTGGGGVFSARHIWNRKQVSDADGDDVTVCGPQGDAFKHHQHSKSFD